MRNISLRSTALLAGSLGTVSGSTIRQRLLSSSARALETAQRTKSKERSISSRALPKVPKKRTKKENLIQEIEVDGVVLPYTRRKSVEDTNYVAEDASGPSTSRRRPSPSSNFLTDDMLEDQYRQAVAERRIPHSELSKVVFKNVQRFPGCIVLTRVGKFYESYFDSAIELVDLLGLNMAWKVYGTPKEGKSKGKSADKKPRVDPRYPFAGFPVQTLDKYLKILVQDRGKTVVLVEEMEDTSDFANETKLKHRRVGRVVTPGTLVDASWLSGDESRYLLSIAISDTAPRANSNNDRPSLPLWLAYTDVSTGEFFSKPTNLADMEDELARIAPREIVLDESMRETWEGEGELRTPENFQTVEELISLLRVESSHVSFADAYRPPSLELELVDTPPKSLPLLSLEAQATSLLQHHLLFALRDHMPPLSVPDRQDSEDYMHIDASTINALEIRHAVRPGNQVDASRGSPLSIKGTLLSVIDKTVTDSGRRLLSRNMTAPLTSIETINHRQELVQAFLDRGDLRFDIRTTLKSTKDIMRLVQRFRGKKGNATDLWRTGQWIRSIERICKRIQLEVEVEQERAKETHSEVNEGAHRLQAFIDSIHDLDPVATKIELYINEDSVKDDFQHMMMTDELEEEIPEDDEGSASPLIQSILPPTDTEIDDLEPPPALKLANARAWKTIKRAEIMENRLLWINPSYSDELQSLHDQLAKLDKKKEDMEKRLREKFEIADAQLLLLAKSPRIGPHIHVSKALDRANVIKARGFEGVTGNHKGVFYGPWRELAIQREETMARALSVQYRASRQIFQMVNSFSNLIQHNAAAVDELDLAMCFAEQASDMGYVRPTMTKGTEFQVSNGRHPVVEAALHSTARLFVPNTTDMAPSSHLHVITGPNQGGKSTFLRQTAMIAILAQAGSFVPADTAMIGIIDKVFSRVGARDDLFRDRSTFMLEMVETAGILRSATDRSLVIMDEIGRGTTLNAGMSIAYATLDYILSKIKCRTLFATHYHELGSMLRVDPSGQVTKDGKPRQGVEFWCTDVDEVDGNFSYSYRLKRGVNFNSHAILAARLAGMPQSFLRTATNMLEILQMKKQALNELDGKMVEEKRKGKDTK